MKLPLATAVASLALTGLSAAAPAPDATSPQYQSTGEQSRAYRFPGTGEEIAYHLYVPSSWNKKAKLPLVVVTHGAVTGYHANATGVGGWNVPYRMVTIPRPANPNAPPAANPPPAAPTDEDFQRAEQDVR